jgi:tetratricopeptide (TPR) repeat protein
VSDRPWGLTLAGLGLGEQTGQLTVTTSDRKSFEIAFRNGIVIGASSPVSADSIARVALTARLLPAAHAADIAKRLKAMPDRDEAAIISDVAGLSPLEIDHLRRRAIVQRVARTFAIDSGTYRFDRRITIAQTPSEVDIRAIIFVGAQQHLSDERTFEDLRILGSRFVLAPDARATLARFELVAAVDPIVDALQLGTGLAEIDATDREIDPRTARATIYALACCGAIVRAEEEPAPARALARASSPAISVSRTPTHTFFEQQQTMVRTNNLTGQEIETLIADRCSLIDAARDLFAVLGLERGASIDAVRAAYLELIHYIHPEKLAMFGVATTRDSERLFATASVAFSTLTDPARRARYIEPPRERIEDRPDAAHEAYVRATRMIEADQPQAAVMELTKACDLAPSEVDYRAALGWALFCAAANKAHAAVTARPMLERALVKSQRPELARFYLGRMERMLGRDREALRHFREVLTLVPDDLAAATEVRVLELRLARGTKP